MASSIRPTSASDARVRWYREYQRARNATPQCAPRSCTIAAWSHMPLRLRHDAGLHYHHAGLVDCRAIGVPEPRLILEYRSIGRLSTIEIIMRGMREDARHRAQMRREFNANTIPLP